MNLSDLSFGSLLSVYEICVHFQPIVRYSCFRKHYEMEVVAYVTHDLYQLETARNILNRRMVHFVDLEIIFQYIGSPIVLLELNAPANPDPDV